MPSNTFSSNDNVSEMLVHIAGDLLKAASSSEELQARLNMVKTAWNISLYTRDERKLRLKAFIRTKKDFAPSRQALKNLESELKQIIKQKVQEKSLFTILKLSIANTPVQFTRL